MLLKLCKESLYNELEYQNCKHYLKNINKEINKN